MFKRLFFRMVLLTVITTTTSISVSAPQASAQEQLEPENIYSVQSSLMRHPGMGGW